LTEGSTLDTKEEAMQSARKELAYVVKTSISSSVEILNQDNTIRSYHDVKEHTTASTNVELKAGDYAVYKQDGSDDGKYYVALCYRCGVQ
jgi:predicted RNase H-like HicB family nuclease